jgi:hypothetical protein
MYAYLRDDTRFYDTRRYCAARCKHNLKTGSGTSRRLLPYSRKRPFDGGLGGSRAAREMAMIWLRLEVDTPQSLHSGATPFELPIGRKGARDVEETFVLWPNLASPPGISSLD